MAGKSACVLQPRCWVYGALHLFVADRLCSVGRSLRWGTNWNVRRPTVGHLFVIPYALLANVCYMGGWLSELLVRATGQAQSAAAFGVKAFRAGITFSIAAILSPAALCWLAFAFALIRGQKDGPIDD